MNDMYGKRQRNREESKHIIRESNTVFGCSSNTREVSAARYAQNQRRNEKNEYPQQISISSSPQLSRTPFPRSLPFLPVVMSFSNRSPRARRSTHRRRQQRSRRRCRSTNLRNARNGLVRKRLRQQRDKIVAGGGFRRGGFRRGGFRRGR